VISNVICILFSIHPKNSILIDAYYSLLKIRNAVTLPLLHHIGTIALNVILCYAIETGTDQFAADNSPHRRGSSVEFPQTFIRLLRTWTVTLSTPEFERWRIH